VWDPNQGVTGKGLWHLQDTGVEVALFPHDLSTEIRIQNAAFIRSQQTLGATILTPRDGDELRTYDAHFGSTGEHVLQLVTGNDLGNALVRYYRTVVEQNRRRREKLRDKVDLSLLGGDFPGIEINGLPKGLRLEASVTIFVAYRVNLCAASVEPKTIPRGKTLKIAYVIESSESVPHKIWLGASFRDRAEKLFHNTREDKPISLKKGKNTYQRDFTVAADAPPGEQMLGVNVWRGVAGDSSKSKWIASGTPVRIVIS
jgi:hypothetical protein